MNKHFLRLLFIFLSLFCFLNSPAQSIVSNPMDLNYRFQFDDPGYREAADPVCEYFNGQYYLFASKSGGYWRSPDLKAWNYIPCQTISEIEAYAPSILVCNDSLYYIASGTKIYRTAHPDKDDWEQIDTKFTLNVTDPAFFQDEDGKVYLYWGCSDKDPIMGVEVNPLNGFAPIGEPVTLITHHQDKYGWEVQGENNELGTSGWNEGPALLKYNGKYYLQYASPGTQFRIYADGVYVADNPLGPFTYRGNSPFSFKPGGFIGGAGHGHTFQDKYGNYWHVATMKISQRHMFERRLGLFPLTITADGTFREHSVWTDYPFSIPDQKVDFENHNLSTGWNLLSYNKPVLASSFQLGFLPSYAVNEQVENWWSAQTGHPGEWLQVDLKKPVEVRAIQVNFADRDFTIRAPHPLFAYQYKIEASDNGEDWTTIVDKTTHTRDAVHELIVLDKTVQTRYLRITNTKELPGKFSLYGFRIFGNGNGDLPQEVSGVKVTRHPDDLRRFSISWDKQKNADGYLINVTDKSGRLLNSVMVHNNRYEGGWFNADADYYFTMEAFNENGITKVKQINTQTRITCIGASITEGARIENPKENSYPGQLQSLLGVNYKVENYGVSSATMLKNGNFPYWKTDAYQKALQSNPNIVFIDLGGNDAKAVNRPFYNELEQDCRDMIRAFKALPTHPRVIVLLPTVFFETDTNGLYDPVSKNEVAPRLQKAAYEEGVEVVDMHPLLIDRPDWIPDKIHPEEKGSEIIAKRLFQQITFPIDEDFDIFKILDKKNITYEVSNFAGYECATFLQNGRECKVVKPKKTAANRPWIWQARFFGHEPQTAITLLEKGYHFVYCDQAERMGNKQNIDEWNTFYQLLHTGGLNEKVVLEGMSRGAVYVFNWAAANPDKVAAVYVDNPLLDMKAMYYGPNGEEKPENEISQGIRENYHIERNQIKNFKESPIDKIEAIVKGHYPILILCAELDDAAVNSQNAFPFEKKIKEKGGDITVIVKKGFGHHPHSFPNPTPIVDFIENAVNQTDFPMVKKYDSYKGLAMAGYQGWFSCPGDGSDRSWYHYWGRDSTFRPGSCKVDMWPDVSEYDKIYKTAFSFADGSPAYVMSEYDESTVETHFRWMREYGIDGVFVQRFVAEIKRPKSYNQLNKVWHSAIHAANANNRAISIMYDLSGMLPGDEQLVLKDIDAIATQYDIKERVNNPSYLHHNGKPLVAVWGVGFNDKRKYGFREAEIIIDALIERGYSVLIGVPTHWRKLQDDTLDDPELHRLIKKCDIVMPWFVGRYNEQTFPKYEKLVKEDMTWCKKNKVDYAPLAFPGFSWVNMAKNSKPIPRNRGSFYWQQLSSHIHQGAEMLYLAMFDEIDEGTAIFKCATEVPVGDSYFLPLDADLGSDYYLKLAGQAAEMLKDKPVKTTEKPSFRTK